MAVTVTSKRPAVVGVPAMVPLDGSMESPAGSPDADQEKLSPAWVSVAESATAGTGDPDTSVWFATDPTVTVLVTVQANVVEPEDPEASVAVTVTGPLPAEVGVPVMLPEEGSIESPAGSPVADQVKDSPASESVAELVRVGMAVPVTSVWPDWLPTATVFVMVQVKDADAAVPVVVGGRHRHRVGAGGRRRARDGAG